MNILRIETKPEIDPYNTNQWTKTCLRISPEEKSVEIFQDYDDNSQSIMAYNGREIEYTRSAWTTIDKATKFIEDNEDTILAIINGYDTKVREGNIIGVLDDNATICLEKLQNRFDYLLDDDILYYTAEEWCQSSLEYITEETTDIELMDMAKDLQDDDVIGNIFQYLERYRNSL